ncbi:MAG: nucleotidyltransferase family protein [Armatimonadetes bacterium]|nr:nucleotidyltransferase family protein [Armatimonadota bacterium]
MRVDPEAVPAVILAGGRDRGALAEATGQPIRALLPIHGRPMIHYVAGALAAAETVGPVAAVGPEALADALPGLPLLPEGPDLLSNIQAGLNAHATDGPVLLLTTDIPFLTPAAVDDFVRRGRASGADLCYPLIAQSVNAARFGEMRRTYARLHEGRFTGGNMMLVRAGFFRQMEPLVSDAYAARKQPFRLARKVGMGLLVRFMLGRLRIAQVESRVGTLLGGSVRAILTEYAEIGADVDKPEDLQLAEALLR